ncbi:MAG TPA: hypothetical protein VNL77_08565, partial [Roseiflexaceae bacterium]|nr:hypothetical protein [Roseiflexaceae bacterium]
PASWRAAIGTALLLGALAATLLLGALWAWPRPRPQAQVESLGTATVAVARAVQPAPPTPAVTRVRAPTPPTSGMTPAPTAPLAAIGAYPTAEVALARVVNLLGGPGLLHEAPAYTSPALPLLLREGDEVLLLPGAPVTADGVEWRLVQAGGLTGWCPAVNLRSRP